MNMKFEKNGKYIELLGTSVKSFCRRKCHALNEINIMKLFCHSRYFR